MRLIVDEKHIEKREKIGSIAPFVGLVLLLAATAVLFVKPEWAWATMVSVWVGFIISLIGGYLGVRYVGPLAHHKKVPEALKGLDNGYALLVYKTPAPFVLVDAGGVTTVFVRSQGGEITYQDGKWRHHEKMGLLRRFAGMEGLGKPDQLAAMEVADFGRFLKKRGMDAADVPVRPVVLFIDPDAKLMIEDELPVPALRAAEFKRWLRRDGRRPKMAEDVRARLFEVLRIEP